MLLNRIEDFMRERRMAPTRFGREAVGDAKFVLQLRAGREPRTRTIDRVLAYLDREAIGVPDSRPAPREGR